jgi:hypothetical protein
MTVVQFNPKLRDASVKDGLDWIGYKEELFNKNCCLLAVRGQLRDLLVDTRRDVDVTIQNRR